MKDNIQAKKIIPWIIAIALFMETLDVTIIVTAIPQIASDFMVSPLALKLALTSYLLSLALFIPISGYIADKWGTKNSFFFALLIFIIGSIGCGRASCLSELVIARVVQGMGGAFMMPVGRLIMLRTFFKSEFVAAINYMVMPALLGPLLGPVVGGFITTYYSWPWIFYVNVPMGILGLVMTLCYIKNHKIDHPAPFDVRGFILFGIGLVSLFFVFDIINEKLIPISALLCIVIVSFMSFLWFYLHYKKTRNPVVNLKLFLVPTFLIAALGNIWMRLGLSSVSFLLPLFFQIGFGMSPLNSGLLICSLALGMVSSKFFNKAILRRYGFRKMLIATSMLAGISIASFALINEINMPLIVILIFINGFISSFQYMGMNVLYYVDITQVDMGQATSISSTLQQLSMNLGIIITVFVLQFFMEHRHLALNNPNSFRLSFLVMGIIAFLSVLIFSKLKSNDGHEMS